MLTRVKFTNLPLGLNRVTLHSDILSVLLSLALVFGLELSSRTNFESLALALKVKSLALALSKSPWPWPNRSLALQDL